MKKLIGTFTTIIILGQIVTSYAQEDTTFMEKREYSAQYVDDDDITIDGVGDETVWSEADYMELDHDVAGAVIDDYYDLSGYAKVCWGLNGLYILVEMTDDAVIKQADYDSPTGGEWEYDCIEIFTNNTGKRDVDDVSYGNRAEQIRVNIGNEDLDGKPLSGSTTGDGTHDFMISYPADGYICEFFLPWDYIKPEDITIPGRWGFSINVGDNDTYDDGTLREAIIGWNNWSADGTPQSDQHWQNINYFGVLFLVGGGVNPPPIGYPDIQIYGPDDHIIYNSQSIFHFGKTTVGEEIILPITIKNEGDGILNAYLYIDGEAFSIDENNSTININPSSEKQIDIIFNPMSAGNYNGSLYVTSNDEDDSYYIISFTGSADDIDGIVNNTLTNIDIFPNPAKNILNIEIPGINKFYVEIFNLIGNKCLSKTITNNQKIDISKLQRGTYLVKVYVDNSFIIRKIVIE